MTALEKLHKKYPPQNAASLNRKKFEFNTLLKAMHALEKQEPLDQTGYDDLTAKAAELFEYISERWNVPAGAAVKGFDL